MNTVDLDGVLVIAHSDKQDAVATWKKICGHHTLMGFVDHGRCGTGEPVAGLPRPRQRRLQHRPRPHQGLEGPWPSCRRSTGTDARH
jgi:hypothetical protein